MLWVGALKPAKLQPIHYEKGKAFQYSSVQQQLDLNFFSFIIFFK